MLDDSASRFRRRLKVMGLSDSVINAAWPDWWSDDADASPSARAELRYSISRKLGLDPRSLLDDDEVPRFVWKDTAHFKHLSGETDIQKWILTSFGTALGTMLLSATKASASLEGRNASELRAAILGRQPYVRLVDLLSICWTMGIPTIHLRVFPWRQKRMTAMSARVGTRSAILLGKDSLYPAQIAFYLAHELAHISLHHLASDGVIVDLEQDLPVEPPYRPDPEEVEADAFALELLTGNPRPVVLPEISGGGARSLAQTALSAAEDLQIEPGTLALCFGYSTGDWAIAIGALSYIYASPKSVWREVNSIAMNQLFFSELPDDTVRYLKNIMGEMA
jgi:Zn-dependent peptidase ImmA (M78 family)